MFKRSLFPLLAALCLVGALLLNTGCSYGLLPEHRRHNWAEINLEREKAGLKPLTWEEYNR